VTSGVKLGLRSLFLFLTRTVPVYGFDYSAGRFFLGLSTPGIVKVDFDSHFHGIGLLRFPHS